MPLKTSQLEKPDRLATGSSVRFLAVIGLYCMAARDSASFRSIQKASARIAGNRANLTILLFDSTPGNQLPGSLPAGVRYRSIGHNAGLAKAFNYGLEIAQQEDYDWLITLDQDTELPSDFLMRITEIATRLRNEPQIAAIVPQICGDGRMLSPNWFWGGAIPKWFPAGFIGVPEKPTFAFNSASTLRVSALRQIGGYSAWFWLDNSDSVLYHQLHRYGKKVFVAGDIQVAHHFSMLDKERRMTVSRYHNILITESAFWDLFMNRFAGLERTVRLVGRWCKHVLHDDSAAFRKETARALRRRLFCSRKYRIQLWKKEQEEERPLPFGIAELKKPERPKVSVCIAACNGEKFIREQLSSVLKQLDANDEVIIVDDASVDGTKESVASFHDERIVLVEHRTRHGVVKAFEHAVRSASGDILFLCDQDDLWAPQKVDRVLNTFRNHPEVTVVTTGVLTIDEKGQPVDDNVYSRPRPFSAALLPNLWSNRFQGSTMAFRSRLISEILPFPEGFHVLHDAWIGLRNTAVGGKSYHIDEQLLHYRRHPRNASHPLRKSQQVLKRLRLCLALISRWFQDRLLGRGDKKYPLPLIG